VDYYFNNFQFNGLSLLLMKDGQPLPIRNNEAKLLAFFLANPDQVFSKDAILENVWAGKVVSEQAVFQAISNLRSVFGDEAIKTYPKKGYQWQLPLQPKPPCPEPLCPEHLSLDASPAAAAMVRPSAIRTKGKVRLWPWVSIVLAMGLSIALYFKLAHFPVDVVVNPPIGIIVEPFTLDVNNTGADDIARTVQRALVEQMYQQPSLVVYSPPSNHSPHQVAAVPAHFLNLYRQSVDANLLVTGRVRQAGDRFILSFVLQGQQNQWKGFLTASTAAGLATELDTLLSKVAPMKVLWESKDLRLINAQLQLLYSENPGNFPMLYQLIDNALYLGDVNNARLRALELEQQARSAGNLAYQALALRAQAIASLDLLDADQLIAILEKSAARAAEVNDPLLHSRVKEFHAVVYLMQQNFAAMEKNMLEGLALAEAAQAPEQQAEILRWLSVYSFKLKQRDKQDLYLARAREILNQYQFPSESYALLEDIEGMVSDDQAKKEQFFWQALNRFTPGQDAWIKERAQEHLVDLYIDQQRWQDAIAVFANETDFSGAELFFRARIHFEEKNFALAQTQAEAAFKQANISGEYSAALEAALLLAQLHQQFSQPDLQKNYLDYINKNALENWKKYKQEELAKLADLTAHIE
jgi:hypothetical protein